MTPDRNQSRCRDQKNGTRKWKRLIDFSWLGYRDELQYRAVKNAEVRIMICQNFKNLDSTIYNWPWPCGYDDDEDGLLFNIHTLLNLIRNSEVRVEPAQQTFVTSIPLTQPVAYLGFQKGGSNICWPLVLTQRGAKPSFPIFYYVEKKYFWPKGGYGRFGQGVNTPLNTTSSHAVSSAYHLRHSIDCVEVCRDCLIH